MSETLNTDQNVVEAMVVLTGEELNRAQQGCRAVGAFDIVEKLGAARSCDLRGKLDSMEMVLDAPLATAEDEGWQAAVNEMREFLAAIPEGKSLGGRA